MLRLTFRGVEYRVSLLFFTALVVMLTLDSSGIPLWCLAASVMHEAGHFLAIYALGGRPAAVSVGVFGVCILQSPASQTSYMESALISLAGPAVNLITFTALFLTGGFTFPAVVHLALGVFNLLPIEPLDGGNALYCLLARFAGERLAGRITFAVSVCVLAPLATGGFYLLIRSGYNFSLLAVTVYAALLLLLKKAAPRLRAAR